MVSRRVECGEWWSKTEKVRIAYENGRMLNDETSKRRDEPFFLNSGFPFLTEAMTMSPADEAGSLLSRAPKPTTEMTCWVWKE